MKTLSILAAAVLSLIGVAVVAAPTANAATDDCGGVRVHIYLGSGADILDLCVPDDLL